MASAHSNGRRLVFLDAATLGDADLEPLTQGFDSWAFFQTTEPHQAAARLSDATVAIVNKAVVDAEALRAAPKLELITVAATGYNNVDVAAARDRGVAVANAPGYAVDSAAAQTFALYFHLAHANAYHDRYVKDGGWSRSPIFTHLGAPFSELAAKRWGVIGMGAIGQAVARAAKGFGCHVVYCSTSGRNLDQPYPCLSLARLLRDADVVSIHAPLNQRTQNLIDAAKLAMMKPNAILINVGRGDIVVERDLAEALDAGTIAGAGLDVLSQEPPPDDHPLLRLKHPERLFMTPHIAWSSLEARQRLIRITVDNIRGFFGGKPQNLV